MYTYIATMNGQSSISSSPTPWHFALACCILKHKPSGLNTKGASSVISLSYTKLKIIEYILSLRKTIQSSSRSFQSTRLHSSAERLDSVTLWKDLFQQSQIEIHQLQSKIATLTKEIKDHATGSPAQKRKARPEPSLSRRVTRRITDPTEDGLPSVSTICKIDGITNCDSSDMILYHIFSVQKLLNNTPVDEISISSHLIEGIRELCKRLNSICENVLLEPPSRLQMTDTCNASKDMGIVADMKAFDRAVRLILYDLTRLPASQQKTKVFGSVVYECLCIFRHILEYIRAICNKGILPNTNGSGLTEPLSQPARERCMSLVARVFLDLIGHLDAKSPLHFQLFEGVTYMIIERCGNLLYILNFGHESATSVEDEIEADQMTLGSGDKEQDGTAKAAGIEAKYLFMFLKRIMAIAPKFYGAQSSGKPGIAKVTPVTSVRLSITKLPLTAKRRLQKTLIKCIWNEKKDYSDITDCLSKPVLREPLPTLPRGHTTALKNQSWFTTEIWKLVGWDVLGEYDHLSIA
jgi:hypothetical protein